jgi:hypothetical protein
MAEQWSPWFAWLMDLLKFVITFAVSAMATLGFIDKIQEKRVRQRSRAEALFGLQMDALQEFRRAAVPYEVVALSAFTDLYQWKGGNKTPAMQRYEGEALGHLNAALHGLEIRFKDSSEAMRMLAALREAHDKRHEIYDGLVDEQLDSREALEMWDLADEARGEFDSLLDEAKDLRRRLIAAVEASILEAE